MNGTAEETLKTEVCLVIKITSITAGRSALRDCISNSLVCLRVQQDYVHTQLLEMEWLAIDWLMIGDRLVDDW